MSKFDNHWRQVFAKNDAAQKLRQAVETLDRRLSKQSVVFCVCRHVSLIHGDQGKGACEGVVALRFHKESVFYSSEPCACKAFEVEQ